MNAPIDEGALPPDTQSRPGSTRAEAAVHISIEWWTTNRPRGMDKLAICRRFDACRAGDVNTRKVQGRPSIKAAGSVLGLEAENGKPCAVLQPVASPSKAPALPLKIPSSSALGGLGMMCALIVGPASRPFTPFQTRAPPLD